MHAESKEDYAAIFAEAKRWRLVALVVACICVPISLMVIAWWMSKGKPIGLLIGGVPMLFGIGTAIQSHMNYTRTKVWFDAYMAERGLD